MKRMNKKLHAGLLALLLMLGVFGRTATAYADDTATDVAVEEVVDGELTDGEPADDEALQEGVTEEVTEPEIPEYVYEMLLFDNTVEGEFNIYVEYEGATPVITFISPSGKEYSEVVSTEEEFLFLHSKEGGWSNFQIVNAEAGLWSVRITKADQETVRFRQMLVEEGIVVQEFTLQSLVGKEATVYFDVTKGDQEYYYRYYINMVSADGRMIKKNLATGEGMTGTPQQIVVYMDASSCENAHLELWVECDDNAGTFDLMTSEEFAYENPDTPVALSGLTVTLDENDLKCVLDWSQYQPWGWGTYAYNVKVVADGDTENPVSNDENLGTTNTYFYYPQGTKELEITVTYTLNDVLSKEYVKKVKVSSDDYIRITADDVTTDAMLPIEYSSKEAAQLTVTINGKNGVYRIKGQDTIFFPLEEGNNAVYATFTGADGITHVIEKDIYLGITVPRITLYEDLSGRTFKTTTARLSGKVENAVTFTISGTEVTLAADGSFVYDVPLTPGENKIELNAVSASGEGTTTVLAVTREGDETVSDGTVVTPAPGDGTDGSDGDVPAGAKPAKKAGFDWKKYLPYGIAGALFVVLLVIFFVVLRKKEKKFTGMIFVVLSILLLVASGVATGLVVYMHRRLQEFNGSLEYIEMARQSLEKAANYLTYEADAKELAGKLWYVTIGCAVLVPIVILVRRKLVYGVFFGKKRSTEEAAKENAEETTDDVAEEISLEEVAEEEVPETEEEGSDADEAQTAEAVAATKEE